MYSTAPAQEQGARLPARCHRRLDFLQNSGQQQEKQNTLLSFTKRKQAKKNTAHPIPSVQAGLAVSSGAVELKIGISAAVNVRFLPRI